MKVTWRHIEDFQVAMVDPECATIQRCVHRILGELCQSDRDELEALGLDENVVLQAADVRIGFINGRAECLFGFEIVPGTEDNKWRPYIVPWLLGTGEYGKGPARREFLRTARDLVRHFETPMCNAVHTQAKSAIRFIEFCGFTVHYDNIFVGPTGEQFYTFTRNI